MHTKKEYKVSNDGGQWYAYEVGKQLGFGWRAQVIWLGYPKKDAYIQARKLGLIPEKKVPKKKEKK